MKILKTRRIVAALIAGVRMLCAVLVGLSAIATGQSLPRSQNPADSFFIISSVDAKKKQIVLKLPTEVTEVVEVTPATTYRDENGRPLKFEDLRAGDTVYATVIRNSKGALIVSGIRRGPMTLEELHRRYLLEE